MLACQKCQTNFQKAGRSPQLYGRLWSYSRNVKEFQRDSWSCHFQTVFSEFLQNQISIEKKTRRGRPRWLKTLHWLAPPYCPICFWVYIYVYVFFLNFFLTCDRWLVTGDRWHMTHILGWTFSENFSSLALPVWGWECLEGILTKGWVNEWVNYWQIWLLEQHRLHRVC